VDIGKQQLNVRNQMDMTICQNDNLDGRRNSLEPGQITTQAIIQAHVIV
jgi:hypothetical protein